MECVLVVVCNGCVIVTGDHFYRNCRSVEEKCNKFTGMHVVVSRAEKVESGMEFPMLESKDF